MGVKGSTDFLLIFCNWVGNSISYSVGMHLEGKKIIGVTILSWGWKKFEVKRVSVLLGTEVLKSVIWRKNTEEMEKYPTKTIIILTEQQKQ